MADKDWLQTAKMAVEADAAVAIAMCKDTAIKQNVELYWVIEQFTKEFCKMAKEEAQ